ncbi:RRQRL motif-containing zinc-binding protein [Streptomyces sp. NPDC059255]|uniref:RRQRL motif-containing zinc-binding protein n=1 Tax=Streptomyces sp. NPDC059255 TaxID=3346793 RepID=UPI0036742C45
MPRPRKRRRREVKRISRSDARLPEYDRGQVPEGLVTRRQLRDLGLSPGGNVGPVAILRCRICANRPQWSCTHPTRGHLLRIDLATRKRIPTLAQEWALDRAMAARSTCPKCRRRYHFCLPLRTQGCCDPCDKGFEPTPDTYTEPPAKHLLAA